MPTDTIATTGAPVGSSIFYAVALILISLLVLQLLRYFLPLRTTPAYLLVPVFLAVFLPANLILLVPIDLASNPADHSRQQGIWLPERVLLVAWRISYWLTFVLTWAILPLLGEYTDSGDREPRDKLLYSLRSNGRYWLFLASASILGAVYFILTQGFNFMSLKGLVMALAYAWGLMLAIYLMGHGLVAVPKKVLENANTATRLKKHHSSAPKIHEKLLEATDELQNYEEQIEQLRQRKAGTSREFHEWIDELLDMTNLPEARNATVGMALATSRTAIPQVITERYLAELTRKFKRARHKKLRYLSEWSNLLSDVAQTQAILDAKPSGKLTFPNAGTSWISPSTRFYLYAYAKPATAYIGGAILAIASAAIVWSELTKSFIPGISLVKVTVAPTSKHHVSFPSQIMAAFWITYMSTCALYSITVLPIWGNRALVFRTTYPESAAWYSAQVAKLTVPLAYNFLTFLPDAVHKQTMFYRFLGALVDLTPLGRGFDGFFPILLLVPVAAALFGVYARLKSVFGYGDLLTEEDPTSRWREGKLLVDRELRTNGVPASRSLALAPSPRASLDVERGAGAAGRPTIPAASGGRAGGVARAAPRPAGERRQGGADHDGDDDSGFFGDFGRRVRNTFDTLETPGWMRSSSEEGSSTGNGGNDRRGRGQGQGQGNSEEGGQWDWGRIFGGGPTEGRVRL